MGGRALVAGFGATVLLLAGLAMGAAYAVEGPAEAPPADLAQAAPAGPAGDDEMSELAAPASAGADEQSRPSPGDYVPELLEFAFDDDLASRG